jgi:hypothetical protein
MGLNRLPNPVLATDATGWAVVSGWTRQASLTYPIGIGGVTTGARFYTTSSESAVYVLLTGPLAAVEPGDTYTVSAYFCGVSATPLETRLSYVRYDALGEAIEYMTGDAYADHEQGVWKRLSKTFVVPAGTAYIGPLAWAKKTAWNDVEMTCFQVEKGDLSDWNDGTVAWTASLLINDDDASTDDNDVVLTIHAEDADGDPPDEMRLAEAPVGTDPGDVVWGAWEPYATTRAWQLAAQTDEAAHDIGVGVEFQRT